MEQFGALIDRYGNLWIASGWVYKASTQQLRESGADPSISLGGAGSGMTFQAGMQPTGPATAAFIGGSGRLLIATPSSTLGNPDSETAILGFYTPDWVDTYRSTSNTDCTLMFSSASSADIHDGTNTVAEWTGGADAPAGVYTATTYGENTYNDGNPFTITLTEELTGGRLPAAADVEFSAGTAHAGGYFPSSAQTFVADDTDWTISINTSGTAELKYLTNVVATRTHTDTWDDPSGTYESTTYGATTFNSGVAFTARVTQRNAYPRSGYAIVRLNMDGTSLESVSKPFFSASIPTDTSTAIHIPLFKSDGSTVAQQLHTGMILWP